jgi:hypothetical protein
MHYVKIFALYTGVLLSVSGTAQEKDTVKVGIYITSLFDLSLTNHSFSADFWLWFNYRNDSLKPLETLEIVNAKKVEYSLASTEKKAGINWAAHKCKADVKKEWNIEHFPFDNQTLEIVAEEAIKDTAALVYLADVKNSQLDEAVKLEGWRIKSFKIKGGYATYKTTYGDPVLKGTSSYPHVIISIVLERVGLGLFFKLFIGVYIAFAIAILVFWIDPAEIDSRFGLSVGSLFAAVGNKYIVDSVLPETIVFTLADKVHLLTFFFVFISLLISTRTSYLHKQHKPKLAKKVDRTAFYITTGLYILVNAILIGVALMD